MGIDALVKILNFVALVAVMLSLGMKVHPAEVLAAARQLRLMLLAILANFVLVPAITVALLRVFQAPPEASIGFLILAVCPGAPVAPLFTSLARGDASLATGLMVVLAALSAPAAPALLSMLAAWVAPQSTVVFNYGGIAVTLLVTQLLPLGVGLAAHFWIPKITGRIAGPVSAIANLLLIIVVVLIVATQFHTLEAFRLRGWIGMLLLLAASLATGWICGGTSGNVRRTFAATTGPRNAAVGLVIVSTNLADTPAMTAVVAYALVSIFGTLAWALLAGRFAAASLKCRSAKNES
jgi:BASS family bile acid:Na+ symporter